LKKKLMMMRGDLSLLLLVVVASFGGEALQLGPSSKRTRRETLSEVRLVRHGGTRRKEGVAHPPFRGTVLDDT